MSGSADAIPYTDADVAYVTGEFVVLEELAHAGGRATHEIERGIAARRLPQPTYVLPDGRRFVPADYLVLADASGGSEHVHDAFVARLEAAARAAGVDVDPEGEWSAYLSGEYGVCLREVSPESIVQKTALMDRIQGLLDDPDESSAAWREDLVSAVDRLDRLERPFAPDYDRRRFGSPLSRDRLITGVRASYPDTFAQPGPVSR